MRNELAQLANTGTSELHILLTKLVEAIDKKNFKRSY